MKHFEKITQKAISSPVFKDFKRGRAGRDLNTYISMLRGINLGSYNRVNMKELERLFVALNSKNVRTYVQSGNVVFEHRSSDVASLKGRIEKEIQLAFGLNVSVFIRKEFEFEALVKNNPFGKLDQSKLHVTFFSEEPQEIPTAKIEKTREEAEKFRFSGREVYLFLPDGYGRSKLSNAFFEKILKVAATTRNWKTVNNLLLLANE